MGTKSEINSTNNFHRKFNQFYYDVSQTIANNFKSKSLYVYLNELNLDEGAMCVIRVQPIGNSFNINEVDGVMDAMEALFSEHLNAAIIFDRSATQLVFEGYDEYSAAYLHLHFLVKKWEEFEQLQKIHEVIKKEEEEKQAIKREAQRVRDEARKKKLAEAQEKNERKLFEKLKKKFGDNS